MSYLGRREFITLIGGAAAWPLVARAQQPERLRRIGYLSAGRPVLHLRTYFVEALRQLGWVEGKNFSLEARFGDNDADRLARVAMELAQLKVDVIVAHGTLGPLAAKRATLNIPIVMSSAGDPLGSGLITSLARPGGNVTRMSLMAPDLGAKRLEILGETISGLSRVAVLWNAAKPYSGLVLRETQSAGLKLGIEIDSVEVRGAGDFDGAFAAVQGLAPGALITVEDPLTVNFREQIALFATKNRLPTLHGLREFVEAGGLMSYGADLADLFRRAAGYVDRILKGARPADLPVEQPTKFQLLINRQAAKALGLEIPVSVLARADEVIE